MPTPRNRTGRLVIEVELTVRCRVTEFGHCCRAWIDGQWLPLIGRRSSGKPEAAYISP
jgi:hypothetical protein